MSLKGNAWRDMAGCKLTFVNPAPRTGGLEGLQGIQTGTCGDITAARKVKVPTVPVNEWLEEHPKEPFPFRWGNAIYLEWFSDANGRVVIESSEYIVELSTPEWHLSLEEEARQRRENAQALDRFMHQVPQEIASDSSSAQCGNLDPEDDPEVTSMVEQVLRIEELKQQVEKISGSEPITGGSGRAPLDVQEQFWKNVLAFENAPLTTHRAVLAQDGVHPPKPDALTEEALAKHLGELIRALARRRVFLDHTDHLSDRELYVLLVERVLDEETEDMPPEAGWNCELSLYEYGRAGIETGEMTYLRYYADEDTREDQAADFDEEIPPHEDPPYDRDRHLPRADE